jgi:hypothetical protein
MEQPRPPAFTADEFIGWALEQPTGRFELSNGIVVAMAPGAGEPQPGQAQGGDRHSRVSPGLQEAALWKARGIA